MSGGGTKTEVIDPFAGTGVRDLFGGVQEQLTPQLQNLFNQPSTSMFAGPGGIQQQVFGAAQGIPQSLQQAQAGFGQAGQALGAAAAPFDTEAGQQFWQQAFLNPAMEQFGDMRRRVLEPFAGLDAADSGAANRALAREAGRVSTGLSGQLANILFSGEQSRLNRLPGVAQGFQNLAGAPTNLALNTLGGLLGIGGVQQGFDQQQASEPFLRQQNLTNTLGQFLPLGLGEPAFDVVQQQQGPGISSILGPAVGGFLGGPGGAFLGQQLFGGGGPTSPSGASFIPQTREELSNPFAFGG